MSCQDSKLYNSSQDKFSWADVSNVKATGCGKVPGEKLLSISQDLVFFSAKEIETSCGKVPGEKLLSNSPRLVVVRYQIGC